MGNAKRAATFLTCVGPDGIEIYDSWQLPEEKRNDIGEILSKFQTYCVGETNETYERYTFNTRNQEPGETFDSYLKAIRTLAKTCNFGTLEDNLIRDRIVIGISDNATKKKLLQDAKLTLKGCINICRTNEQSSKQVKTMRTPEDEVAKISLKPNRYQCDRKPALKPEVSDKSCLYCGRHHPRKKEMCPAWGKQCNSCGTLNHFASECRKSRQRRVKKPLPVNTLDDCSESTDSDDMFYIENVDSMTDSNPHQHLHRKIKNKIFA